jgi:hypothetical protein
MNFSPSQFLTEDSSCLCFRLEDAKDCFSICTLVYIDKNWNWRFMSKPIQGGATDLKLINGIPKRRLNLENSVIKSSTF